MPGVVGGEYFMTKGHRHTRDDRPEYYWNIEGEGFLVLYDGTHAWVEKVERGSVHYVPGNVAHRLVNTGNRLMKTGACWPADAGHDYTSIAERGFPLRILKTNDGPNVRRNPAFHADS
jgi:glucose-6-phosphate isomerase